MSTEAFRKDVSRQLTQLQDGVGPEEISFPATLTSEERKYVHNLCHQFGLASKSKGNGAGRYLTVRRKQTPGGQGGGAKGACKGGAKGAAPGQLGAAAVQAPPSQGTPFRVSPKAAADPRLARLAAAPAQWSLTAAADPKSLGRGRQWQSASAGDGDDWCAPPCREALDEAEDARLAARRGYAALQASRRKLPAWAQVDEVVEALQASRVVLVAGETGCGKSTQVPQFLLDAMPGSRFVVTQPRRIAAVALAQRVAQERCEEVGKEVGYAIHMERKASAQTRCTFCTTGVFRRRLLGDPRLTGLTHVVVDEVHERELHGDFVLMVLKQLMEEREDLNLILMSATLQLEVFRDFFPECAVVEIPGRTYPVHRMYLEEVVATLWKSPQFRPFCGPGFAAAGGVPDEKVFKRQVATQERHPDQVCGFGQWLREPMTRERLADGCYKHDVLQQGRGTVYDIPIIDALILHLDREHKALQSSCPGLEPGAILIFFPGWGDIDAAKRRLRDSLDPQRFWVLPCHSQVRPEQQREIFKRPPAGVRKIILASNIAETSITVEDVMVVIDTGRAKETSYDPYLKVGTLATTFVSKASAAQRAGRAGRTKEGLCFHLFSRTRHQDMEEYRAPEMLRSPLEDVCLHTAHLLWQRHAAQGAAAGGPGGEDIAEWLATAPQPPEAVAVRNAVDLLKVLGALTPRGEISGLGVKLANLPLPATMARSVIWGSLLGCLDEVLAIISSSSGRDPFQLPSDPSGGKMGSRGGSFGYLSKLLQQKKRELAAPAVSDHVALLRAAEGYEREARRGGDAGARAFCDRFSLNARALQSVVQVRDKMKNELKQQRLLADSVLAFANRNAGQAAVVLAVVAAGVYPNLAVKKPAKKKIEVNAGRIDAGLHPQSILDSGTKDKGGGKGKGGAQAANASDRAEWYCYTEMTQVEQRYSMTGISRVSPVALLLLCGDDPFEVQGTGPDVSASLLDGWAEFVLPRAQAGKLQNLRYALRQAFLSYCEAPSKVQAHAAVLDCAVSLLLEAMDEDGVPASGDGAYRPTAPARAGAAPRAPPAGAAPAAGGRPPLPVIRPTAISRAPLPGLVGQAAPKATGARPVGLVAAPKASGATLRPGGPRPPSAPPPAAPAPRGPAGAGELPDGQELAGIQELVRERFGQPPPGQKPITWRFGRDGDLWQATLSIPAQGSEYCGEWSATAKLAQRSAARTAWEGLSCDEADGGHGEAAEGQEAEDAAEDVEVEDVEVEDVVDDVVEDVEEVDDAAEPLLDEDVENSAALRFLQGDINYLDGAEDAEADAWETRAAEPARAGPGAGPAAKRRRRA